MQDLAMIQIENKDQHPGSFRLAASFINGSREWKVFWELFGTKVLDYNALTCPTTKGVAANLYQCCEPGCQIE